MTIQRWLTILRGRPSVQLLRVTSVKTTAVRVPLVEPLKWSGGIRESASGLIVEIQTDEGLVVPVVRDCDTRSVEELGADVARLAESARAGSLKPEELRGSTFTVTSAGKLGGLMQTPIVNYPEVAILSIGRIGPRPVVLDGQVVAAETGYVSLTFDHRVVDGARAAEFGLAVIRKLEER